MAVNLRNLSWLTLFRTEQYSKSNTIKTATFIVLPLNNLEHKFPTPNNITLTTDRNNKRNTFYGENNRSTLSKAQWINK